VCVKELVAEFDRTPKKATAQGSVSGFLSDVQTQPEMTERGTCVKESCVESLPVVEAEEPEPSNELSAEERKGKLKEVRKEGGEMAITLDGVSQMGGVLFFCESVTKPCGDVELLVESMKAMNAQKPKKTRAHQDPLGGSDHLGKFICVANARQVVAIAYVPKELQDKLSPQEWMQEVTDWYGGEIVQQTDGLCVGVFSGFDGPKLLGDVKYKATDILQRKRLMADDHAHDDEEHYGDDDHPGVSDEQWEAIRRKRSQMLSEILGNEDLTEERRKTIQEKRRSLLERIEQLPFDLQDLHIIY